MEQSPYSGLGPSESQIAKWIGYTSAKVEAIDNLLEQIREEVKQGRNESEKRMIIIESELQRKLEENKRDLSTRMDGLSSKFDTLNTPFQRIIGGLLLVSAGAGVFAVLFKLFSSIKWTSAP